jgi:hypothetical protein
MATPADQRLLELLEKWLKSLELHLRYASLDSDSYLQVQPWPEHQRPSRWIIELAMQKAQALRVQVEERIKMGDAKFSDSLELMTFLANLLGSEHIERFIPLADPATERAQPSRAAPRQAPGSALDAGTGTREMLVAASATREMPEFVATQRRSAPVGSATVARTERKGAGSAKAPAKTAAKPPGRIAAPAKAAAAVKPAGGGEAAGESAREASREASREQVIADAARLVQWGRKWFELAELIARMAGRPSLPEVRRILKDNKTAIEQKAGRR